MTKQQINEYMVRISQSSKTGLVVISCEIASVYMKEAKEAFRTDDKETFLFSIKKAMDFVDDLSSSLDMSYEISKSLISLYTAVKRTLIHANAAYTLKGIDGCIRIMDRIGEAFEKVAEEEEDKTPSYAGGEQIITGVTYGRNSMLNEYIVRK